MSKWCSFCSFYTVVGNYCKKSHFTTLLATKKNCYPKSAILQFWPVFFFPMFKYLNFGAKNQVYNFDRFWILAPKNHNINLQMLILAIFWLENSIETFLKLFSIHCAFPGLYQSQCLKIIQKCLIRIFTIKMTIIEIESEDFIIDFSTKFQWKYKNETFLVGFSNTVWPALLLLLHYYCVKLNWN